LELNLHLLLPEFILAGAAFAVIVVDLLTRPERRALPAALTAALGFAAALAAVLWLRPDGNALAVADSARPGLFVTAWRSDAFSLFFRGLVAGGGLLLVLLAIPYTRRLDRGHGEFHALILIAALGVMLVSGVQDLLSLFVCLELVTINSFVLAAFKRNDLSSTEAGLKYLVVGAVSTAFLLLGVAFVYGATGSVSFDRLAEALGRGIDPLLGAGVVLLLTGLLFKVGGVPFQVWMPDVYQGAPTPVTAFLSTASKSAGIVLLLRLAQTAFLPSLASPDAFPWDLLLGVVAAATLVFGTLGAIAQRSVKRFFAYSSIGHAGWLLMGVAAVASGGAGLWQEATAAVLFYLLAFFFTNLTAFAVIVLVGGAAGSHESEAYSGLARRSPFLAFAMLLSLLSLAGVPPLSGFFGKFLVLKALVADGSTGCFVLAFLGAAAVAVSLYFYLLWIKQMFVVEAPVPEADVRIRVGGWSRAVLVVGILAMLVMGVFMGPFYDWAQSGAASLSLR
jgi:NADH-quinone oxidoreductase subunit N